MLQTRKFVSVQTNLQEILMSISHYFVPGSRVYENKLQKARCSPLLQESLALFFPHFSSSSPESIMPGTLQHSSTQILCNFEGFPPWQMPLPYSCFCLIPRRLLPSLLLLLSPHFCPPSVYAKFGMIFLRCLVSLLIPLPWENSIRQ